MLAACNSDKPESQFSNGGEGSLADTITVSAATSLTNAFNEIATAFNVGHPFVNVNLNYGASTALADAIVGGAPADVFASADQSNMTKLQRAGLVFGDPTTFAHNKLAIVTKPGNPAGIKSAADLPNAGVISLCALEVPCGKYAAQALVSAKVTIDESRVTRGQNVAATLDQVAEGDAVAAIVYVTDALAKADRVDTVAIPETQNVIAAYPIAKIGPADKPGAKAFIKFVKAKTGQRILKKYGFLP
ncbi:MAG: molybdate ABC transporter substrate-binding protein [Acidimicrobiales bacterium]|nr:molybdate ABC transporter substrate-binding protein [Acidimicrobiales bacterium]